MLGGAARPEATARGRPAPSGRSVGKSGDVLGPWDERTPSPTRRGRRREGQGETDGGAHGILRRRARGRGPDRHSGTDTGCGHEDGAQRGRPPTEEKDRAEGKGGGAKPTETGTRAVPGGVRSQQLWSSSRATLMATGAWVPPHRSSDHSVRRPHKRSPSSLGHPLPYWGPEGRGCPGWGSARESEHRERVIYRICPAHQYPAAGHPQSPQDTHPYTQVRPQKHTPRDLAHSHEFTLRNTARDSPSAQA